MNTLLSLLIFLLVVGVIFYVVSLIPLPHPFGLIVQIILALVVIVYLLGMLGVMPGVSFPRLAN